MSDLERDPASAESSNNGASASAETPSTLDTAVENKASEVPEPPAKVEKPPVDSETHERDRLLQEKTLAHQEEIERLKEAMREQNARLEAATKMLSGMQPPTPVAPTPIQPAQAQSGGDPPAATPSAPAPPPAPERPAAIVAATQNLAQSPSLTTPLESSAAPPISERISAHNEEMERLKERLRDQDARLEATTRLLTSIHPAAQPSPAPTPPSRMPQFAVLGGAAALAILAGFLYLRSQSARSVDQNLAQPQIAAGAPLTAQPESQTQTPAAPSAPAPVTQASQANPQPPLPLPDAQQGPPPDAIPPPDATPPPAAAPVEKPVLDDATSRSLTDYLHQHRLPYVDAMVYQKDGALSSIALSGEVRTEKGKDDAETKSRDFLGNDRVKVRNHVKITADPGSNTQPVGPSEGGEQSAGTSPGADPCLCQSDEGHCEVHCQDQFGSNAAGGFALGNMVTNATQLRDCNDGCQQTQEHCEADCNSGGSNQQSNSGN